MTIVTTTVMSIFVLCRFGVVVVVVIVIVVVVAAVVEFAVVFLMFFCSCGVSVHIGYFLRGIDYNSKSMEKA